MAYELNDGEGGQVENEPYCMKKSFQCRNTMETNEKTGRFDMSDLANTPRAGDMKKATPSNMQKGPEIGNPRKNDNKGSAY